jgi:uncharacterized membrane protein YtjA (UPF0391 family)
MPTVLQTYSARRARPIFSILFRSLHEFSSPGQWEHSVPDLHWLARTRTRRESENRGSDMLGWVVTFLIIALIAGILGFGGIAGASIEIAKIIFFIAVVLFLVSAVIGVSRGRTRV